MLDATDLKAHATVSSLNKGGALRLSGGAKGDPPVVCHSPLRLHLSKGQCSDFTGADGVLKICRLWPR